MKEFEMMGWVTVGGTVGIEAKTLEEANDKFNELLADGEAFSAHPTFNCTHSEYENLGDVPKYEKLFAPNFLKEEL